MLELVDQFLAVESQFQTGNLDAANLALVKANKDALPKVIALNLAHRSLRRRASIVTALLRAYGDPSINTTNLRQAQCPWYRPVLVW